MYGYISVEGFLPSAELLEGKFGASNGKLAVTNSNFPIPDPKFGVADSNFELPNLKASTDLSAFDESLFYELDLAGDVLSLSKLEFC